MLFWTVSFGGLIRNWIISNEYLLSVSFGLFLQSFSNFYMWLTDWITNNIKIIESKSEHFLVLIWLLTCHLWCKVRCLGVDANTWSSYTWAWRFTQVKKQNEIGNFLKKRDKHLEVRSFVAQSHTPINSGNF